MKQGVKWWHWLRRDPDQEPLPALTPLSTERIVQLETQDVDGALALHRGIPGICVARLAWIDHVDEDGAWYILGEQVEIALPSTLTESRPGFGGVDLAMLEIVEAELKVAHQPLGTLVLCGDYAYEVGGELLWKNRLHGHHAANIRLVSFPNQPVTGGRHDRHGRASSA